MRLFAFTRHSKAFNAALAQAERARSRSDSQARKPAAETSYARQNARPPGRHSGIRHDASVEEVEDAMGGQACRDDPEVEPEACYGRGDERRHDQGLDEQRARRSAHDGEKNVVRRDHREKHRVEHAVAVEPHEPRHDGDEKRDGDPDGIRHGSAPVRRQLANPEAAHDLHGDQREVHGHEEDVRQVNEKRREAEDGRAHELRETDVSFRESVMQEVTGLHDQERNVRVSCIQTEMQLTLKRDGSGTRSTRTSGAR